MTPQLFGILLTAALLGTSTVSVPIASSSIQETIFVDHLPDPLEVTQFSLLPGVRNYLLQARNAWVDDLERVLLIKGAQRIQIESDHFPAEDTASAWKRLADQGVEFVGLRAGMPVEQEIRQLNAIRFQKLTLVLSRFPTVDEAKRLKALQGDWSITFATASFPKFEDKAGLEALPAGSPLFFVTDYWPAYTHMDLLNLLPQNKAIRVAANFFPTAEGASYLNNIKKLNSLAIQTDLEPQPTEWAPFKNLPLTWICKNFIPSDSALQAFIDTGGTQFRKIVLDTDRQLTSSERDRINRAPVRVDWIHLP